MDSKNKYCIGDVVVLRSEVYKYRKDSNELVVRTSCFDGYTTIDADNKYIYRIFDGNEIDYVYYFAKIEGIKTETGKNIRYKCLNTVAVSSSYQWAYENDILCNTGFKNLKDAMSNSDVSMYVKEMTVVEKESSVLVEQKISTKDSRKVLFEDDSCMLEKRNNRYYFSLYNEETGEFIREISIYVRENGKVSIAQYA